MLTTSTIISRFIAIGFRCTTANRNVEKNTALRSGYNLMNNTRIIPRKKTSSQIPRVRPFTHRNAGTVLRSNTKCPVGSDAKKMQDKVSVAINKPSKMFRPSASGRK
jgi:hypothetical protein